MTTKLERASDRVFETLNNRQILTHAELQALLRDLGGQSAMAIRRRDVADGPVRSIALPFPDRACFEETGRNPFAWRHRNR